MDALEISFSGRASRLRSSWILLVAAALLLLTGVASPARAAGEAELGAARARFADLDFEGALKAFQAVAADASTEAGTRAAALTGQGLCQQVLGRPKEARASFLESLALDPQQKLPADTSPKLRRPFAAARQDFQKNYAPKLSLDRAALPSGSVVIRTQDALGLVQTVEVLVSLGGRLSTLKARGRGDGSYEARPKGSGKAQLRVRALNGGGIEVASLGIPKALAIRLPAPAAPDPEPEPETAVAALTPDPPKPPPVEVTPEPSDPEPTGKTDPEPPVATVAAADPSPALDPGLDRPDPARGSGSLRPVAYGFAGGAAAALGGAIALGLSAKSNEKAFNGDPTAFTSQTEALETGRAARSQALGSNLLYGGAALLAGGAALFYFWPGSTADAEAPESSFAIAPTGDGVAALFTLTLP